MKKIIAIILCLIMAFTMFGCRKANTVNYNISQKADNFGVYRRITVINVRDNSVLYELEGFFALNNSTENELIVTSEIGHDDYRKDYIYLSDWTTYVVEQLDDADVSPYHYKFTIIPRMMQIYEIDISD